MPIILHRGPHRQVSRQLVGLLLTHRLRVGLHRQGAEQRSSKTGFAKRSPQSPVNTSCAFWHQPCCLPTHATICLPARWYDASEYTQRAQQAPLLTLELCCSAPVPRLPASECASRPDLGHESPSPLRGAQRCPLGAFDVACTQQRSGKAADNCWCKADVINTKLAGC
jgi:hypothetical protein